MKLPLLGIALSLAACTRDVPKMSGVQSIALHAEVEPGTELTVCRRVALDEVYVERFEHAFDGLSHHFFVYESNLAPAAIDDTTFACDDEHDLNKSALLYASQRQEDALAFPDDVAYEVADERTLLLEWHLVNPSSDAMTATATLDVATTDTRPEHLAGMLVYYHPFIHVPPHGSASADMRCMIQEDVTLLWSSSHMHARGVAHEAELERRDGSNHPLGATDNWEDAEVTWLGDVPASRGDFISFGCDYDNPASSPIVEGPAAGNNEMCMFFAGYYPRMPTPGADACSGAESGPVFDGDATCEQSLACLTSAADPIAVERCWAETRAASTKPLLDLTYRCAISRCGDTCDLTAFDASCTACLADRCADERSACSEG